MNKKDNVIEKARLLFTKYGYKKVSMDEIAKEAGVTKKTIYSYFSDKEDLFKFFIKEELNKMKEIIEKDENDDLAFVDRVSKSINTLLHYRKNSLFYTNILNGNDEINKKFLKMFDDEIIKFIEMKLIKEMNLGNIKKCNAHLTAFIIYHIYILVMFEYENDLDEDEVTLHIVSILNDGLVC